MARREVIEIVCDRCGRVETQATGTRPKSAGPEASFTFQGATATYEDMCRRCRDSVGNYFAKVTKTKSEEEENNSDNSEKSVEAKDSSAAQAVKKGIFNRGRAGG